LDGSHHPAGDCEAQISKPLNEEHFMTQTYRIASIPADGVGKEVIAAGRKVLDYVAEQSNGAFAFQWDDFDWGSEYYARHGKMMADDGLATLKDYDAIYFGAVGWSNVPDHISLWGCG
jgi:tartrate dehydrogenase/decarboxylase/D-malate dehydrogenase